MSDGNRMHLPPPTLDALERSQLDLNDLGNARRLLAYGRGWLYWIEDEASYVYFDGRRFSTKDGKAAARNLAIKVADGLKAEFMALKTATTDDLERVYGSHYTREHAEKRALQVLEWSIKSGESAKAAAMLEQAKGLRGENSGQFLMQARPEDFDVDPLAYHCANGVLRFGQGEDGVWRHRFSPGHDPADMMRQISTWSYDGDAQAPAWTSRMDVMQPDPVARTAIKRIYGMTLTGLISDQAFYIFQGKGQDGKSTSNDVIGAGHGDYFRQSGVKTFLEGPETSSSGPQSDLVRLSGDVRMVVCDEPKPRSTWNGERIKQFTGSKVTARGVHARTEISFAPRGKLIVECNQLPKPPSDDRGFRRRHKIIPHTVQFGITPGVADAPVHEVTAQLMAEQSGILNWMIVGALEWLNERVIPEPLLAQQANASYWSGSSVMADFLKDCCDLSDPEQSVGATALYNAFRQYRIDAGDDEKKVMSQTTFGSALTNMQIYAVPDGKGYKVRKGIRLIERNDLASGGAGAMPPEAPWGYDDDVPL